MPATESQQPAGHYVIDGEVYAMRIEPRCKSCIHPQRREIDTWLLAGNAPSVVISRIGEPVLTSSSVGRHRARHLPVGLIARDALLREQGDDEGIDLGVPVQELLDARRLARLLAERGAEAVLDGTIVPQSFADVVRATDLLIRTEQLAGGDEERANMLGLALMRLLRHVRDVVPAEVWAAISDRVQHDDVLAALERAETGRETDESRQLLESQLASRAW